MRRPWRPAMTASAGPQQRPLTRSRSRPRSLASIPPLVLFCTALLLLVSLVPGVAADSRPRNPLRTIARVEDAVLHSPSHRVHALSSFQISLTLHQEDEGRRLPVRLRLTPNHDILADDASIHHINADGSIGAVERINRLDHRVFMGHAFVQTGHSLVEGNINDGHWINAGWASIYVHVDGDRPIFEGAFHLAGDHHHIQTSRNFISTRIAGDPVIELEGDGDGEYMVVWRDSDVLPDAAMVDVELRRRLRQRGLDAEPIGGNGNETINSMHLLSPACSSDGLLFNQDNLHPVFSGISVDGPGSADSIDSSSTQNSNRWLFGRQIDGNGDTGGGSAGVNLASTIGNPSGCPTTRKVALMGIAADCNYASAFSSRANTSDNIIMQINSASRVYESTFNITLGIQNLIIQNDSCPTESTTSATPWNAGCSSGLTITDRLNLFSKWRGESANDTNAFWMLLSTCATDSAVGLAWLGQLCVPGAQSDGSNETIAATNVVVRTSTEWQVMAHEAGHTFGAVHDCTSQTCADGTVTKQQCCPLSASECNANGAYIMNPSTGTGITQFSACTMGNICSAMGRNSVKSTCLSANKNVVTVTGSECGNGIVEEGEECDCGGTEGCGSNACCDPTTCKFTANALCDPSNDECCTSTCQLASSGSVCRPSTGSCDPAETCSGTSATCPEDVTSPDGTACGSSGAGLACASGQCTSRDLQCKTLMGSLTTSNDTYACSDQGCQLSCASPEFGANTCLSMSQNFLDGTPCQGGGHCSNGDCEDVSVAKEIAHAFRTNLDIVIPVAVVIGILLLLAISSCVYSIAKRRRRRRHLQELARMGMPPPPMAPRKPGFLGLGGKRLSKTTPKAGSGVAAGAYGAYGAYNAYNAYNANASMNRGYGAGGPPLAPAPKPEDTSTANAAPSSASRWAFWRSRKTDANTAPAAGDPASTSGESINAAAAVPNMRSANNTPMTSADPNLPPSVGAWRASGYGGGPVPRSPPPMPSQSPPMYAQLNPQSPGQQWQPRPYQTPRYA
ncbi:hypothetical protein SCUCBS95973_007715 [Sporothrix curviconia]|uniref:Disintegrin and metalloproteinase domain-containing protein B n=1 Tax=Sporothrix curviconia TaxID=1260050 RepID=A0ABP0CIF4_9PEZI